MFELTRTVSSHLLHVSGEEPCDVMYLPRCTHEDYHTGPHGSRSNSPGALHRVAPQKTRLETPESRPGLVLKIE